MNKYAQNAYSNPAQSISLQKEYNSPGITVEIPKYREKYFFQKQREKKGMYCKNMYCKKYFIPKMRDWGGLVLRGIIIHKNF